MLLVATNVYSPAAIEQLRLVGRKVAVTVVVLGTDARPVDIAWQGLEKAWAEDFDAVIVDTAGRLQVRIFCAGLSASGSYFEVKPNAH